MHGIFPEYAYHFMSVFSTNNTKEMKIFGVIYVRY